MRGIADVAGALSVVCGSAGVFTPVCLLCIPESGARPRGEVKASERYRSHGSRSALRMGWGGVGGGGAVSWDLSQGNLEQRPTSERRANCTKMVSS